MTLADYLDKHGIKDGDFALRIGVDRSNVSRMRTSGQIPKPHVLRAIARETSGEVTADDFFGICRRSPAPLARAS